VSQTFLAAEEISELTGIRTGKDGKSREQLQSVALKKMHIPHYVNARGRPIVARAIIEGGGPSSSRGQPHALPCPHVPAALPAVPAPAFAAAVARSCGCVVSPGPCLDQHHFVVDVSISRCCHVLIFVDARSE